MFLILARVLERPKQGSHRKESPPDTGRPIHAATPRITPTIKSSAGKTLIASSTSKAMISSSTRTTEISSSTWTTIVASSTSTMVISNKISTTVISTTTTASAIAASTSMSSLKILSTHSILSTSSHINSIQKSPLPAQTLSPTHPSPSPSPSPTNSQSISSRAKVGIAVGAIVLVLFVSLFIFLWRRKVRQAATTTMPPYPGHDVLQRNIYSKDSDFVVNMKPELSGTPHPAIIPDTKPKSMTYESKSIQNDVSQFEIAELEADSHIYAVEADSTPLISDVLPNYPPIVYELSSATTINPTSFERRKSGPHSISTSPSPRLVSGSMSKNGEEDITDLKLQIEVIRAQKEHLTAMQALEARERELNQWIVKRELRAKKDMID